MSGAARADRQPSLVRRAMIVNTALSLIAEQGLAATTARQIANAAGVSLGTITYHFASIDEILVQVLQAQTEQFERRRSTRLAGCSDPRERLRRFLTAYLDPDVHPPAMWQVWLDCWSRAAHSPTLRDWQLARYREVSDRIAAMLADVAAPALVPAIDARTSAREFLALVDGLGEQVAIDTELGADAALAILDNAVDRHLRAFP